MTKPHLYWFRRDLRLDDHPGLTQAILSGAPIVPVFILDPQTEALGAAPKWRLGEGLRVFAEALEAVGSRLILRRGEAQAVLHDVIAETGASHVHWSRLYDPASIARDTAIKSAVTDAGLTATSHPGHVLFEPWTVQTGQGGCYKVYTPFWRAVRGRDVGTPLAPARPPAPSEWPASERLTDWDLGAAMHRGAAIVASRTTVGAAAADARLQAFVDGPLARYATDRDRLDMDGTSGLSAYLSLGEISARRCWTAAMAALEAGNPGAETFAKEVVWRDFAHYLMFHTPHILERSWREEWQSFPWQTDGPAVLRWKQGRTGEPVIDAAMRELYVTGRMHNRARMLVASYLTKHLMTHWRIGQQWFEDCLIDWDPASNAMGWQWAAGSGPDAAPYFRVFNPATQAEKFDPKATYRHRWVAELTDDPGADALAYFDASPQRWGLSATDPYPAAMVDLKAGREAALAAYKQHREDQAA